MLSRNEILYPGRWVAAAAMVGDAEAMRLSFLSGFDSYCAARADLVESIKWLKRAADLGYIEAWYLLAGCYREGWGVPQDAGEAALWYLWAAIEGHAGAQFEIGACFAQGLGVPLNYRMALKWYQRAARQRDSDAEFALEWNVGKIAGVPWNHKPAAGWYRRAAEQGDAMAQNNLAGCYLRGWGVAPDFAEAFKWCGKAADRNLVEAQTNLGLCYLFGHGVPKNRTATIEWFRKAAAQGFPEAQANVGCCYHYGWGVDENKEQAAKWYQIAAEQGHAVGQHNLGFCYEFGDGVENDCAAAMKWYRKSAAQGYFRAKKGVERLAKELQAEGSNPDPEPPGAPEKAEPGAKRIVSGMVTDTLVSVIPPPRRIVLVDHEDCIWGFIEKLILHQFKNVIVQKFQDRHEAWQELLRKDPDLLITDMRNDSVPIAPGTQRENLGMSGFDMLKLLAARRVKYPILAASGCFSVNGWERYARSCAGKDLKVFYIAKPFTTELFHCALDTCLSARMNKELRRKAKALKIVIVNDEEGVLKSCKIIIKRSFKDAEVLCFDDSAAALKELIRSDPDLLITDDTMPGMSGQELCLRLFKRQITYPIVMHSSWGEQVEWWVRRLADEGFNISFLLVPFDIESLVKAVEAALKRQRDR